MSSQPSTENTGAAALPGEQARETLAHPSGDTGARGGSPSALTGPRASAAGKPNTLIGQTCGDLEFVEELGRGGMGIVYKARQISLDRFVAVKLLLADYFQEPVRLARFQAEARAAASLNHPNIVQVYQVGECPAGHFFSMEFIDGHSVEAFLRKRKITVTAALSVLATVADALHYAHGKGVIHRDLKPANVMIDRERRPVIMDFGIAKMVGQSSSLTQQGVVMGTPTYMAPEQAEEGAGPIGPHTDVYSLGAILYTVLTGQVPYDEGSALRTILKVIGPELPPPVHELAPEVPEELDRICMKCLQKKPAERYLTAQAFANDLRRFRTGKRTGKAAESTVTRGRGADTVRARPTSGVVLLSHATGKEIRIERGLTLLGRSSDCEVVLRAADVSKRHCQLLLEGSAVLVEDLASANGTFVNGQPVRRAPLRDGDKLSIGEFEFTVRLGKR